MKFSVWSTLACALVAGMASISLFLVKHEVKEQEARLAELNKSIQRNQEQTHVLNAEWTYLNDPARLKALAQQHLKMDTMAPAQMARLQVLDKALSGQYAMVAKPTIRADKNADKNTLTTDVAKVLPARTRESLTPSNMAAARADAAFAQRAKDQSGSPQAASGRTSAPRQSDTERLLDELSRNSGARASGAAIGQAASRNIIIHSPAVDGR